MMTILPVADDDRGKVIAITENLSEWFDEAARRKSIPTDLKLYLRKTSSGLLSLDL